MKFKDFADTSPSVKLERGKEYPFIPMDVIDGQHKFPLEVKRKSFSGGGSKFINGDTIFARITPCLENGKIVKIQGLAEGVGFGSTEFFVFRGKDGVSDSDFVYYLSRTDTIRDPAIKSMVGASGRQRADKGVIDNVQVMAPALPQQKQIADVLSAYDDLIENNTRRIKILEKMAQAIYKEWFVYFCFPGHEKAKMVDSKTEFGKIPEGWEVREITKFKCLKFSKPKMDRFEGVKGYYATADIGALGFVNTGEEVTFDSKPSRAQIQPNINSVWFARMKDTRKIVFFRDINSSFANTTLLSSGMAGFQSESYNFAFMFSLINSDFFHVRKDLNATGATQVSLTDEGLKQIKMIEPPLSLIQKYSQVANLWLDEILLLQKKNEILRQARDLLLPKLVSGEIEIKGSL